MLTLRHIFLYILFGSKNPKKTKTIKKHVLAFSRSSTELIVRASNFYWTIKHHITFISKLETKTPKSNMLYPKNYKFETMKIRCFKTYKNVYKNLKKAC